MQNFNKNEYFIPQIIVKKLDNIFLPKQKLNAFRRQVYDAVVGVLTENIREKIDRKNLPKIGGIKRFENFQYVYDLSAEFTAKNIVYSPEIYQENDLLSFKEKCESNGKKAYLDLPNFATAKDVVLLKNIIKNTGIGVVANNYYALNLSNDLIIGGGLNVYNHFTANELKYPFFTAESELGQRQNYYYMTFRHCPMKNLLNSSCEKCVYQDSYEYVLDSGKDIKLKRKKLTDCTFYLSD